MDRFMLPPKLDDAGVEVDEPQGLDAGAVAADQLIDPIDGFDCNCRGCGGGGGAKLDCDVGCNGWLNCVDAGVIVSKRARSGVTVR